MMFGLALLDIAVGLVLIFIVLSIICSSIQEAFAALAGLRARNLRRAIELLLPDAPGPDNRPIALSHRTVLGHGLIGAVFGGPESSRSWFGRLWNRLKDLMRGCRPGTAASSYIVPSTFAAVVVAILQQNRDQIVSRDHLIHAINATTGKVVSTGDAETSRVNAPSSSAKATEDRSLKGITNALIAIAWRADRTPVDGQGLLTRFEAELASWFETTMQRISGWYTRQVRLFMATIALVVVVVLNVDIVRIASVLAADEQLRIELNSCADEALRTRDNDGAQGSDDPANDGETIAQVETVTLCPETYSQLGDLIGALPLGWPTDEPTEDTVDGTVAAPSGWSWHWIGHIPGWLLAIAAIMLGGPFWFDFLGKVSRLRGTGPRPRPGSEQPNTDSNS